MNDVDETHTDEHESYRKEKIFCMLIKQLDLMKEFREKNKD